MAKHVFVPFPRDTTDETDKWVSSKALEWRTTKDRGIKHAGLDSPLGKVKDDDTIWVQAEGYTDNLNVIGSSGKSKVFLSPLDLLKALVKAGLDPDVKDVRNLKIKIWACFSGFSFAQSFYNQVVKSYPTKFRGLMVYGYNGGTRLGQHKTVKPATLNSKRDGIHNWDGNTSPEVAAKDGGARVQFGPKP
jgi:hypothetical protein